MDETPVPPHDTTPPAYKLLPGESVISDTNHERPDHHPMPPSALRELLRLTSVNQPNEIGSAGPAIAALSRHISGVDTPEHLRLYETLFGRDSLRVAIDLISSYPQLARATILTLAKLQGVRYDRGREEEPGRIVHEARHPHDPIAVELTEKYGWRWPYYGSVDATPEFIRTLTAYCQLSEENRAFLAEHYTDRAGEDRTISYALEMALGWIENRLNHNEEGILEFQSELKHGIENQVWKDSWDAYHHSDGTIVNHSRGVSSIEVQVTTYDALIDAAELYEDILDDTNRAQLLRARATTLRSAIFEHYWTNEKGGYFVLGTDRDADGALRQLKVRTSNMGHALNSRILKGHEPAVVHMREQTVKQILSPELLNVSGIRTLASDEVRFRPGAYHNGSVWLWDTHHIAKGLRRLGYGREATDLDLRILRATNHLGMFPEYVRGDNDLVPSVNTRTVILWDDINHRENKVEQPPQEVQAWTVAAILATKRRFSRDLDAF